MPEPKDIQSEVVGGGEALVGERRKPASAPHPPETYTVTNTQILNPALCCKARMGPHNAYAYQIRYHDYLGRPIGRRREVAEPADVQGEVVRGGEALVGDGRQPRCLRRQPGVLGLGLVDMAEARRLEDEIREYSSQLNNQTLTPQNPTPCTLHSGVRVVRCVSKRCTGGRGAGRRWSPAAMLPPRAWTALCPLEVRILIT